MLEVTTLGWALTIGVITLFYAIDMLAALFRQHEVSFREAVVMTDL
jgi:tellurite resistance protein TerC